MTNASGIEPIEFNVLVRPYEVPKQTKGGLFLPDEHHDRVQWAETRGTVVAMSPLAFGYEIGAPKPNVGDDVMFSKHSGGEVRGLDDNVYRMLKDKDVLAVIRKEDAA